MIIINMHRFPLNHLDRVHSQYFDNQRMGRGDEMGHIIPGRERKIKQFNLSLDIDSNFPPNKHLLQKS